MKKKRRAFNLKSSIISHLRKIFFYSPFRQIALSVAKRKLGYQCAKCKKIFDKVKVDHIDPVVPTSGWVDWNSFIARLFCDPSKLQCLCEGCHNVKTKTETKERKNKSSLC